jgi:hypothetical protein
VLLMLFLLHQTNVLAARMLSILLLTGWNYMREMDMTMMVAKDSLRENGSSMLRKVEISLMEDVSSLFVVEDESN